MCAIFVCFLGIRVCEYLSTNACLKENSNRGFETAHVTVSTDHNPSHK